MWDEELRDQRVVAPWGSFILTQCFFWGVKSSVVDKFEYMNMSSKAPARCIIVETIPEIIGSHTHTHTHFAHVNCRVSSHPDPLQLNPYVSVLFHFNEKPSPSFYHIVSGKERWETQPFSKYHLRFNTPPHQHSPSKSTNYIQVSPFF